MLIVNPESPNIAMSISKGVDGDFHQDLYYRINVIELPMPPLRVRADDLSLQEPISPVSDTIKDTIPINSIASPLKDELQIKQALEKTRGNRKAAAELLGITY